MNKKYVIYAFFDNNNNPFYIGQTCNFKKRKNSHLSEISKKKPIYHQHRKAKSLLRKKLSFSIEIILDNLTEKNVNKYERFFIKKYKKLGLTNSTNGGRDYFNHSKETRDKISKNNSRYWKNKKKSKNHLKKMSLTKQEYFKTNPGFNLGQKRTKAQRLEMSKRRKGFKYTQAQKKRLKIIRNKIKPFYTKFWKIISPRGKVYLAWGLGSFCRRFNLSRAHLLSVSQGTRRHHKKWTCSVFKNKRLESRIKRKNFFLYYTKKHRYLLK